MNEHEYLQRLSALNPDEFTAEILGADERQAQVLRIYFGADEFDRLQDIARQKLARGAAPCDKRGNVVVLHGIMGGELSEYGTGSPSALWVQILNLIGGRFDRLALDVDGNSLRDVRASGIYLRYYGSLLLSLNLEWKVRPFFYDWRRDIRFAAEDLNTFLTTQFPAQPVHLVGHSMGGLVARSFIARHSERWNVAAPNGMRGNLIMLGTPNFGSFAIPRLLLGTNDILELVSKIDIRNSKVELLDIARTFKGAYQMMPARGHIDGLDLLYKQATYNSATIVQKFLDDAALFQSEIAGTIDPARMAYVAGYNRVTPAAIKDVTRLGNDSGYVLSKRGDGTVPHDLGLLPGVKTFYVDEEHAKLPANPKVQKALSELLATCTLQNEDILFKGLGPEFDGQRGTDAENQQMLQASQASRRAVREQQADALRNAILSRGSLQSDSTSPEQQALADLLMQQEPVRLSVAGQPLGFDPPTEIADKPVAAATVASKSPEVMGSTVEVRIRILEKSIGDVSPGDTNDAVPIDCIAVGHYLRVLPTGAERDLDLAISAALGPNTSAPEQDTLLNSFHERGILRGDLGVPYFLPDPRKGHENVLLAIGGMGQIGEFGMPELSLLARELCWSAARLGKKHLATVLIGSSVSNLSMADAVHAWIAGIKRAVSNSAQADDQHLEAITFFTRKSPESQTAVVIANALEREASALSDPKLPFSPMKIKLFDLPAGKIRAQTKTSTNGATHINIDFDQVGVYRYSAMTGTASIPERVIKLDPRRVKDVSQRILTTIDPEQRYKLGKFLLDFLFPQDLRSQLTGSAPVVLQLNNEAAKVYWEIAAQPLTDDEPFLGPDAMPYLGLQRGLTRQLRTVIAPPPEPPPPLGRILRILVVADGNKEARLPGAQKEAQQLLQLFDEINRNNPGNRIVPTALIGPSKATTLDVLLNINDQPPFDVLHYAGHCVYDQEDPERSGLLFSGDDRLTASDLNRLDRTPKFVFANACESGIMPSRADLSTPELPASFAEAFFAKGVANFICTAWPVSDAAARDFAEELYRNLLAEGLPMFEALRAARRKISSTLTWGAYQHYGDPYFRLLRQPKSAK